MTDEALALRLHHRVRLGARRPGNGLGLGLGLGYKLAAVLTLLVEVAGLAEVPAQPIAIVCGLPLNFRGQKLWSFAR